MHTVRLKSVKYSERLGQPKEWFLDTIELGQINLLVGRNATGKSRTLNLIAGLARMFVPEPMFRVNAGSFDVLLEYGTETIRYVLCIENGKVVQESYYLNGEVKLERGQGGEGNIFAEIEGKPIRFKPPENEVAAVSRRDILQHPFLEPLHKWALSVRHYTFGTPLGKEHLSILVAGGPDPDERDSNQVIGIFRKGNRLFGPEFVTAISKDMASIGYELDDVLTCAPESVRFARSDMPGELACIGVKEKGIKGIIDQTEMSQGMFRALSIIIQINYSQMASSANCILIDDIGEGLDFDRSTRLIDLLRQKASDSSFQLIMTTNDRFVMNNVPIEEWSVLQRDYNHVKVLNINNSPELFEEFKFTGLSNFSFLEMDYPNMTNSRPEEK